MKFRGKAFFSCDLAMVLGPGARTETVLRFCDFLVVLADNFEFMKMPRESFLAVYDCCLVHPTPDTLTRGVRSAPQFRVLCSCLGGAVVAVRKPTAHFFQMGAVCCLNDHAVSSDFFTNNDHCTTPKDV